MVDELMSLDPIADLVFSLSHPALVAVDHGVHAVVLEVLIHVLAPDLAAAVLLAVLDPEWTEVQHMRFKLLNRQCFQSTLVRTFERRLL